MADADSTLELLIKMGVIGQADVAAANDLLKQTGTTAAAAGDSGKEMGKKLSEADEEGTHAGHGLFESHREVHKLLHTIGNDAAPGMGHALAALAGGPLGAVIALGMAVEFVKKNIEATNKKLDEMAAAASKAFGGGDWLTDYVKAAAEAAIETENLAEALKHASDAGPEIKNRYEGEAKAIKEIVDAIKAKLKVQEEAEIIEARAAGKKSGASAEVISAKEAEIRARYESRDRAAGEAAEQALREAQARELAERQKNKQPLEDAAAAKTTPARVIQTRAERSDELTGQEAALAKATSEVNTAANDDLNEKIEGRKHGLENMIKNGTRESIVRAREAEIAELESQTAENRMEDAKQRIEQLSKQVANDQKKAAEEKSALDEATTAATENAKRIVELQKQIAEANTAAQIKTKSVEELVRSLHPYEDVKTFEKTAGVDTPEGAASLVQKFQAAQSRLHGHKGTGDDQQLVKLLNQLLATTQQSDKTVYLLLEDLIKHKGDVAAAMQDLAQQTGQTVKDLRHSISMTGY